MDIIIVGFTKPTKKTGGHHPDRVYPARQSLTRQRDASSGKIIELHHESHVCFSKYGAFRFVI